jgi:light-regulated signal transduction histidine kinase (bacteriophytochrome)
VQQALADLQTGQADRKTEVVVGKLPTLWADPVLIKQVFINLLSNALKFTRGKKNARVEIGSKIIKGETVYFVKDNGAGFDMRYADKLFGVFQRLHSEKEYEGTGIGLAIVQRIIHHHGGRVWAEAQVGKGAVFYFTVGGKDV